jgi:hypothetical protein
MHLVGVPYYFTYIDDAQSNTKSSGIYNAFIMIIISLIIGKSRLLQNYNKILTKVLYSQLY